jgi:hypothetical protein
VRIGVRRRACALALVVALLTVATTGGTPAAHHCAACPPQCPMHAKRLGCHQKSSPPCHRSPALPGLRAACGATEPATPSGAFRAVMPALTLGVARAPLTHRLPSPAEPASEPDPEPSSPPPRAVVV